VLNRSPEVGAQAEHTLTQYQSGVRTAESLDELEANLDTSTPVRHMRRERLATVISIWTIVVLAIAAAATWFIDRVMAVWIVALVTAIVMSVTLPRERRTSDRLGAP
jgi:Flp pilus assembly protein TadB